MYGVSFSILFRKLFKKKKNNNNNFLGKKPMQLYVGFWEYIHHYTFLFVKYCRGQLLASLHFIYKIYFSEKLKTVEEVH